MKPGPVAALVAYLTALVVIGFVHDPGWLAGGLALAVAAAGRLRWRLLRRSLVAILTFNLGVSLGYLLVAAWQAESSWSVLIRLNLRVTLLVFIGFWFVARVNLLAALRFSPTLVLLATVAAGHIVVFRRVVDDFRCALISRGGGRPPPWRDRLRHAGGLSACLFDKSVTSAERSTRALRSRGCFDD